MSDEAMELAGSSGNDSTVETVTLYAAIDREKVFGLNVTVPEDAKEVIKPWDARYYFRVLAS